MGDKKAESRRDFLKGSTAALTGAALASGLSASIAHRAHAKGDDRLRVALIGCGGRGNGAVMNCLTADESVRLIAVADAFEDKAKASAERWRKHKDFAKRVEIPDERIFVGLDAYQKAIDCGPDMVILATPPGFRPMQYSAAIAAGKHVFMEKPCCVDAPGFRKLMDANQMAKDKGLKVGVGLQRHHSTKYQETIKRIRDGAIGKIQLLRAYWNGSGIWVRRREPWMTELQYQVFNWYHFCWVCGDNICEQHVHNLDVCNWVMDDHPIEANGMGGCEVRYRGANKGVGQIFDHHFVEFTYPDGTKMYSQCRHIPGCQNNVSEAAHGTKGESNCNGWIKGESEWNFKDKDTQPYVQEHIDLIKAIRAGEQYHEGWYGATSSMTAVLGRTATYSGKVIKWEELVAKGTSEFPEKLAWDAEAPVKQDADGNYPIPTPGVYKPY